MTENGDYNQLPLLYKIIKSRIYWNENKNISIISSLVSYNSTSSDISNTISMKLESFQTTSQNKIKITPSRPSLYAKSTEENTDTSKISNHEFTIAAMPAYNEEKYIAKMIIGARKYVNLVLVIDDGSSDSTSEIAAALGAMVIRHPGNKGYGRALKTIFEKARDLQADKLVILDSDGQHDPQFIPILLKPLDSGVDIVIGSRFLPEIKNEIPGYRIVGMKILDKATNIAGNLNISDSQSGYRAFGKRAIELINIDGNGMGAGSEILLQINDHQLKIAEAPINVYYSPNKKPSQNPVSQGISVLINIITFTSIRRPLVFFGIPGLGLVILGIILEIYSFFAFYKIGSLNYILFTLGLFSLIIGLLISVTGLMLYSLQVSKAQPFNINR